MERNFFYIGFAGDWHGDTYFAHQALASFASNGITEVCHVGDFGVGAGKDNRKFLRKINQYCKQYNIYLRVTLGNHENYKLIAETVPSDVPGFTYFPEYAHVLFAERGARWVWNNVSFVSLGGANSIDFKYRKKDYSWWVEERITLDDVYQTVKNGYADVMVTHEVPAGVDILSGMKTNGAAPWSPTEILYANKSRETMRQAVDGVKPGILIHGHYHRYANLQTVLFDGVDEYSLHSVCLNQNRFYKENIGMFDTFQRNFELLDIPRSILQRQ